MPITLRTLCSYRNLRAILSRDADFPPGPLGNIEVTDRILPSNYGYLHYLLHKRPGIQQDVDHYLRKTVYYARYYDRLQYFLKGPGDQEDAVDFLDKILGVEFMI